MTDGIAEQLARLDADLAPYDETIDQALNTARLRDDPTYLDRWVAHDRAIAVDG